jgi:hypothetical protein
MVENTSPVRSRALRTGRPDGSSTQAHYVVYWTDEDTGRHTAHVLASSEQDVRDALEPYIGSNTLQIKQVGV